MRAGSVRGLLLEVVAGDRCGSADGFWRVSRGCRAMPGVVQVVPLWVRPRLRKPGQTGTAALDSTVTSDPAEHGFAHLEHVHGGQTNQQLARARSVQRSRGTSGSDSLDTVRFAGPLLRARDPYTPLIRKVPISPRSVA